MGTFLDLSTSQYYIETFPHFLILTIFENVETSLYRNVSTFLDFVYFFKVWKRFLMLSSFQYFIIVSIPHSGTEWNTNDDRYSDFGHFFENVETSIS